MLSGGHTTRKYVDAQVLVVVSNLLIMFYSCKWV